MPLSNAETERTERTVKRAIIRRDVVTKNMNLLYDLAKRIESVEDVIPLFKARKRYIESNLSHFNTEQNTIIDTLVELGREDEYASIHAAIETTVYEQYYFIIAIDTTLFTDESAVSDSTKTERSHIQLPTIQISNFDGDILRWCTFRDTFESLVHANTSLSNIERFHYLLSAVSGSASSVVRSIPLSGNNYKVAWDALKERYDNQRLIMNDHLDKLFSFPPLKSSSLFDLKSFLDTFQENIAALTAFDVPDKVGFLLFYIASRVLDPDTKCLFESDYKGSVLPVIDDLIRFVKARCHVLQNSLSVSTSSLSIKIKPTSVTKKNTYPTRTSFVVASADSSKHCPLCKNSHYIYKCEKFHQLSPSKRLKVAQSHRLCTNCLSVSHTSSACKSKYTCRECSAHRHSLLHLDTNRQKSLSSNIAVHPTPQTSATNTPTASPESTPAFVGTASGMASSLLGTAVIRMRDQCGQWISIRALIDCGSQISTITHTSAVQLGLSRRPTFILSKITGPLPFSPLSSCIRSTYNDLDFADPSFDRPGRIDFLLGADLYNQIFEYGYRVQHTVGLPSAYETTLGWIFVGTTSQSTSSSKQVSLTLMSEPSLNQLLNRFWECEEPVVQSIPFTEEEKCEDIFRLTTTREDTGRYSVSFPFKKEASSLGDSRAMAMSRFFNLERKLQGEPKIYSEYRAFMHEYLILGHMQPTTTPGKYIIPHHAVIKHVKDKINLRVVFYASARTSSGVSLNDILFVGPNLQCDIMNLLICSRLHRYMFTANICKMYRQINMLPSDCKYQHILWRSDPSEPLLEYSLSTVTYGIASSPYQALRVLHQLEEDEGDKYPEAQGVLSTQTYVDDIITGAETVEKTLSLQQQVTQLLSRGGLELKKWASNCPEVLQNFPTQDHIAELSFNPKDNCSVKILGLHWDPILDIFSYHSEPFTSIPTKRSVLSAIAKIYDPLGTLAPITFWAKCFMQILWKNGYSWDEPIAEELSSSWKKFSLELPCVSSVRIQRHIPIHQSTCAQLIGFCDASLKGFAAIIYIRLEYTSTPSTVHLVTSKSKVAPLKSGQMDESLTIPRLELCGALLLAQTLHRVQQTLAPRVNILKIHAWTDSTVVFSWLTAQQTHFKIFVTNRLKKIAELLPSCHWHYVNTLQNPADCVSRGMFPAETMFQHIYWNGPEFLKQSVNCWSFTRFNVIPGDKLPERKPDLETVHMVTVPNLDTDWLERFSSLQRLQRTLVHMRRFISRARGLPSHSGFIRQVELEDALKIIVKLTQYQKLHKLIKSLSSSSNTTIPPALARLAPFIDTDGIIRVGGRLRNSNATEDFKCPILLPKTCVFMTLLVRRYHIQHLHAGPQLVSSLLSARFWIMSSRSVIRHITFKCVICARHRASKPTPIMGDLPKSRICPSRPFSNVGIDYAGPLLIKEGKRRNARSTKCYLVIFVCMAIKAVHIEVVSDLSTSAFIAALHRFIARRGVPANIYSDCGTKFQGTSVGLRSLLQDSAAKDHISSAIPCRWHLNPPATPHFGGLWKAAVKSAKHHLKRFVGRQVLTFEEMITFTQRIEAILNSRLITPQSSDPNYLRALTPGDFFYRLPTRCVTRTRCSLYIDQPFDPLAIAKSIPPVVLETLVSRVLNNTTRPSQMVPQANQPCSW